MTVDVASTFNSLAASAYLMAGGTDLTQDVVWAWGANIFSATNDLIVFGNPRVVLTYKDIGERLYMGIFLTNIGIIGSHLMETYEM